jgi:hypothetical protein
VYKVPIGVEELRALVAAVRPTPADLSGAEPEARKAIYQAMVLRLTYHPERNAIAIDACTQVRVGGAFDPAGTPPLLRGEVLLRAA